MTRYNVVVKMMILVIMMMTIMMKMIVIIKNLYSNKLTNAIMNTLKSKKDNKRYLTALLLFLDSSQLNVRKK